MNENFIDGIFVDGSCKRDGLGTILINYLKSKYERLFLKVYEKNIEMANGGEKYIDDYVYKLNRYDCYLIAKKS